MTNHPNRSTNPQEKHGLRIGDRIKFTSSKWHYQIREFRGEPTALVTWNLDRKRQEVFQLSANELACISVRVPKLDTWDGYDAGYIGLTELRRGSRHDGVNPLGTPDNETIADAVRLRG